ncbi:hypothetical protein HMPREF1981_01548 [Bacteroides pyogenes F0041]|uniref:Uncharacterized protein n=1 Tax=Bacteroides pyogenes F0041 TaxID=1321819 RepID=U2DVE1_9BACE|nr:hypothetical protein HMPREF1981_01548 [Bacteroides pyogenes F0041]
MSPRLLPSERGLIAWNWLKSLFLLAVTFLEEEVCLSASSF